MPLLPQVDRSTSFFTIALRRKRHIDGVGEECIRLTTSDEGLPCQRIEGGELGQVSIGRGEAKGIRMSARRDGVVLRLRESALVGTSQLCLKFHGIEISAPPIGKVTR